MVRANLRGARRLEEIGDTMGIYSVCPPLGPYLQDNSFGMGLVVCILLRKLDPWKTDEFIQFSMVRQLRSMHSNLYHALSLHQMGMAVMAQNTTQIWVTTCPLYGYWFDRFMEGVHKQMGKEVQLDYALSIGVLHQILGHLDKEWDGVRTIETRNKLVVKIAMFLVSTFCLGLWGEEVVKLDIAGFLTYFEAGQDHPQHKHVMLHLLGCFKGETGECWHFLPIV
jgi:hypothetical protein